MYHKWISNNNDDPYTVRSLYYFIFLNYDMKELVAMLTNNLDKKYFKIHRAETKRFISGNVKLPEGSHRLLQQITFNEMYLKGQDASNKEKHG